VPPLSFNAHLKAKQSQSRYNKERGEKACHGFGLTMQDDYFRVHFDYILLKRASFYEAAGAVVKISLNLKVRFYSKV